MKRNRQMTGSSNVGHFYLIVVSLKYFPWLFLAKNVCLVHLMVLSSNYTAAINVRVSLISVVKDITFHLCLYRKHRVL